MHFSAAKCKHRVCKQFDSDKWRHACKKPQERELAWKKMLMENLFLFQSKKTHSVYQSCPFLIGRWINGFDLCTQHAYKGIEL